MVAGANPSSHTVTGTESIYDYSSFSARSNGSYCTAPYGYYDLTRTNAVAITDAEGRTEYATLYSGTVSGYACVYKFSLTVQDSDSYSVRIGNRNTLFFSRSDLEDDDWTMSVTIGDD